MRSGDFFTIGSVAAVFVIVVALAGIFTYIRRAFAHHRVEQYIEEVTKTALEAGDTLLGALDSGRAGEIAEAVGKLRARNNVDLADAVEALGSTELAWRKQTLELRQVELRHRLDARASQSDCSRSLPC